MGQLVANIDFFFDSNYEYDSQDRVIYIAIKNEIKKITFNNKKQKTIAKFLNGRFSGESIDTIALDWVTKNLYVTHHGSIILLNARDTSKEPKTLHVFQENNSRHPVIVFPNSGYLVAKTTRKHLY